MPIFLTERSTHQSHRHSKHNVNLKVNNTMGKDLLLLLGLVTSKAEEIWRTTRRRWRKGNLEITKNVIVLKNLSLRKTFKYLLRLKETISFLPLVCSQVLLKRFSGCRYWSTLLSLQVLFFFQRLSLLKKMKRKLF